MSSTNFTLLVNRIAERMVYSNQRFKARLPISPFFFTIAIDVLIRILIRVKENDILVGGAKLGCHICSL